MIVVPSFFTVYSSLTAFISLGTVKVLEFPTFLNLTVILIAPLYTQSIHTQGHIIN